MEVMELLPPHNNARFTYIVLENSVILALHLPRSMLHCLIHYQRSASQPRQLNGVRATPHD